VTSGSTYLNRQELPVRLPTWRLIAAVLVLGGMAFVLLSLAPVYLKDLEFQRSVRTFASQPAIVSMTDEGIRGAVMSRAEALGLPVLASNVQIIHDQSGRERGKVKIQLKYAVHFELYQVDLHFHTSAASAAGRG
jgi:hypothetical protein